MRAASNLIAARTPGRLVAGLLLVATLSPLTAQTGPDTPPKASAKATAAKQKATTRLLQDLVKIEANLARSRHAYRGNLTVHTSLETDGLRELDLEFRGCRNGAVHWFFVNDWRVVEHGKRSAVVRVPENNNDPKVEEAWQKPQGDSPDVPLSPSLFVPHLSKAELSMPMPAEHDGRPALRIHARWRGKPATRALYATTVPSTQHEQILEALGRAAGRPKNKLYVVDAVMLYDPAAREWLASTMRFAYLDGRPIPDDVMPPAAPEGMPTLTSFPMIEATWHMTRCDNKDVALPELNERAREILRVDAAGKPLPTKAQAGGKKAQAGKQPPKDAKQR